MISIGEPCILRRVTVDLTPEQQIKLARRYTGKNCGNDTYEEIHLAILETNP